MTKLEESLREIEKRAEGATEGPISIERRDNSPCGYFTFVGYNGDDVFVCAEATNMNAKKNAEFFAHSRADIPALIKVIRVLSEGLSFYADKSMWANIMDSEGKIFQETIPGDIVAVFKGARGVGAKQALTKAIEILGE